MYTKNGRHDIIVTALTTLLYKYALIYQLHFYILKISRWFRCPTSAQRSRNNNTIVREVNIIYPSPPFLGMNFSSRKEFFINRMVYCFPDNDPVSTLYSPSLLYVWQTYHVCTYYMYKIYKKSFYKSCIFVIHHASWLEMAAT